MNIELRRVRIDRKMCKLLMTNDAVGVLVKIACILCYKIRLQKVFMYYLYHYTSF